MTDRESDANPGAAEFHTSKPHGGRLTDVDTQRAVETSLRPESPPAGLPLTRSVPEPTKPAIPIENEPLASGVLVGSDPLTNGAAVQRQMEEDVPPTVAPLLSDTAPMGSVVTPATDREPDTNPAVTEFDIRAGQHDLGNPHAELGDTSISCGERITSIATQRAVETTSRTESPPAVLPLAPSTPEPSEPAIPIRNEPSADGTAAQRQAERDVAPTVAPLISDTTPIGSAATPAADRESVTSAAVTEFKISTPHGGPLTGGATQSMAETASRTATPPTRLALARSVPEPSEPAILVENESLISGAAARRLVEGDVAAVTAPLVSDAIPMESVSAPAAFHFNTTVRKSSYGGFRTGSSAASVPLQRSVETPLSGESARLAVSDTNTDCTDPRHTVTHDSVSSTMVGLIGDRSIESAVSSYGAAGDSTGAPGAVPAFEQARGPAAQRHVILGEPGRASAVSGPGAPSDPATMAVQRSVDQRSMNTGAYLAPWPPSTLTVNRSSPDTDQRAEPVQFTAAEPDAVQSNPLREQLNTPLFSQRVATEPASATDPVPAIAISEPAATGSTAGSTSPTEVDTLVNRLYDPLVRRIKAELQRDRERAGRSLDLWH